MLICLCLTNSIIYLSMDLLLFFSRWTLIVVICVSIHQHWFNICFLFHRLLTLSSLKDICTALLESDKSFYVVQNIYQQVQHYGRLLLSNNSVDAQKAFILKNSGRKWFQQSTDNRTVVRWKEWLRWQICRCIWRMSTFHWDKLWKLIRSVRAIQLSPFFVTVTDETNTF